MSENNPCCYFHPREVVVGVCSLCLKERLLVLASKQGRLSKPTCIQQRSSLSGVTSTKSKLVSITIPRVIFALGSTFLHWRSDLRHFRNHSPKLNPPEDYISSLEDSFISIKFGDDGKASWDDKKKNPKEVFCPCNNEKGRQNGQKVVVEHAKANGTLRWRRRACHLLQVMMRWRSSSKKGSGQSKGWIRSLITRRRRRRRSRKLGYKEQQLQQQQAGGRQTQ